MRGAAKLFLALCCSFALLLAGYLQGYLHGAIGGLQNLMDESDKDLRAQLRGKGALVSERPPERTGFLNISVAEKPFGMHVRRGSLVVEEVFPGFPAQKLGVHRGCEVRELAGAQVTQGTWLDLFQNTQVPFELKLYCPPSASSGEGPLTADKKRYRVMVVKKPFGMNVQVNVVPRVVDVLPGYPAEKAGVRRGYVLTAVNDVAVNASTWYTAWQQAQVPCTLTFDTTVPVRKNNPFFSTSQAPARSEGKAGAALPALEKPGRWVDVTVQSLPFGMHVNAKPGSRPEVQGLVAGMPAAKAGVQEGDILVEVAGRQVDAATWFAAFEEAVPPFGLHFWRRGASDGNPPDEDDAELHVGPLDVIVAERPYGMHVQLGSATVDEVFGGFPAISAGIRPGCQILAINGSDVNAGTWLEAFRTSPLPFPMKLNCPPKSTASALAASALASALVGGSQRVEVVVKKRPFGMNVQTNTVPRVVEVLPGYPAEAAGVRRGYVLVAVDGVPVNTSTWFDAFQRAPTPCKLTFDTSTQARQDNPFFNIKEASSVMKGMIGSASALRSAALAAAAAVMRANVESDEGYSDVRVKVTKAPFGMEIAALPGGRPVVASVSRGLPADEAGVRPNDVLVEVAGLQVDSSTWFAAFQQASFPFGLRLRRPRPSSGGNATRGVGAAAGAAASLVSAASAAASAVAKASAVGAPGSDAASAALSALAAMGGQAPAEAASRPA